MKTEDVFGVSRELPSNYIERLKVDKAFKDSLARSKHIVIFGSSKQGKTSLRKKWLKEDQYVTIHCSNKWQLYDLNANILKKAGFELSESRTKSETGRNKILAKISATLFGAGSEVGAEKEKETTEEETTRKLELDLDNVNDVIDALNSVNFDKIILLEDFHYLQTDTQRDFSFELKAFHENSDFLFVIIGVWLDENRLATYNGDLVGRIVSINADNWNKKELMEVIQEGERLLNISIHDSFKNSLLEHSNESVYIVQECCYQLCVDNNISERVEPSCTIGEDIDAKIIVDEIISQQSGRYNSFLTNFADGFQSTTLEMYKWILFSIIKSSRADLEAGLRLSQIKQLIISKHPSGADLNPGNLTQSLKSVASLQVTKNITPIVIDYDETNLRLRIVDKGFLIWLGHQNSTEMLELIGLPTD